MPQFKHFDDTEKALLKQWSQEGTAPSVIATRLGRSLSAVVRQLRALSSKKKAKAVGRPRKLTEKQIDMLVQKTKQLTKAADAKYQVIVDMIRKVVGFKCCNKVLLSALHARGIYVHPLREKPVRTEQDEIDRKSSGEKYTTKPLSFWETHVHAHLDNKFFPVYLTHRARTYAAKRAAKGTFRTRGDGFSKGHVKPRKTLKVNFGARSVMISAAISGSKVLMWHRVKGQWNAAAACEMYERVLAPALQAQHPSKRRFCVLEDNDPATCEHYNNTHEQQLMKPNRT